MRSLVSIGSTISSCNCVYGSSSCSLETITNLAITHKQRFSIQKNIFKDITVNCWENISLRFFYFLFHTRLTNFGFTPLLWHPQCPQGCLKKRKCLLTLNLVVWCTKIGPKTKKFWKTSEMTRETSKNNVTVNITFQSHHSIIFTEIHFLKAWL